MIGYGRLISKMFMSLIAITLIIAAGMIITVKNVMCNRGFRPGWLATVSQQEGEWLAVCKLKTNKV
jgi:hypothetical protein